MLLTTARALLVASSLLNGLPQARASVADPRDSATHLATRSEDEQVPLVIENSYWYDWGWHGSFPHQTFESFGAVAPIPNIKSYSDNCSDEYTFIEPRGIYVRRPGPMILDNRGDLVWMHTQYGQAMDVKVQKYQGKNYITFWRGADSGTFGEGYYLMIDETYEIAKKVKPVGPYTGDLHEFRITERDTALMTIYEKSEADMTSFGIENGWIFDSVFQEVDLVTGDLIFEWHASHHFSIDSTSFNPRGKGVSADSAFDFFHINSIDEDNDGNFLISGRYLCGLVCISKEDGSVLWQLGGKDNDFKDLSGGRATDLMWNHHAAWVDKEKMILSVFDNGSNGDDDDAEFSRALLIQVDLDLMTATVVQSLHSPEHLLSQSQGSVQILPNGNRLVGWGHRPAWTEFSAEGEVLCDVHIGPVWMDVFGWVKNYRTFKYDWVGRPNYPPSAAMRPSKNALFVSWNGATEVKSWQLQSGPEAEGDFSNHGNPVTKTRFEMRINVPSEAGDFVRIAALDADGEVLMYSDAVSKFTNTEVEQLFAPIIGRQLEPLTIFSMSLAAAVALCVLAWWYRALIQRGICALVRKGMAMTTNRQVKYQPLPMEL